MLKFFFNLEEQHAEGRSRFFEYEKKFVSSITLGSAAGLITVLSFAQNYETAVKTESYLRNNIFSIWFFVGAIVLSGALPFFLAKKTQLNLIWLQWPTIKKS